MSEDYYCNSSVNVADYNFNGSIGLIQNLTEMPAYNMPIILRIDRILCIVLGIPLNLAVMDTGCCSSSRSTAERSGYLFWMTITFFNLLSLGQSSMELSIYYLNQQGEESISLVICRIYSVVVGCPYALLLTALTLATADRYSALVHPQFYQNYVTRTRIGWTMLFLLIIIIAGQTFPFWTGFLRADECRLHFDLLLLTLTFHGLMSATCFILQIRLYLFLRSCIRYSAAANSHNSFNNVVHQDPPRAAVLLNSSSSGNNENHADQSRIITGPTGQQLNELEVRAAKILSIGILPFCLINLPASIFSLVFHFIRINWGLEQAQSMAIIMVILRELILFHLIYIPIILVAQSRRFGSCSNRSCRLFVRCCCNCRRHRPRNRPKVY